MLNIKKLASDLLAAERFIKAHEGRDDEMVTYGSRWLAEMLAGAALQAMPLLRAPLTPVASGRPPRRR